MSFPGELSTVIYEERDNVGWITLNRPEVHNAFDDRMQRELQLLWRGLRRVDSVRAVVITGAGEHAFCSGVDRVQAAAQRDLPEGPGENRPNSFGSTPFMFSDAKEWIGPKTNGFWKPVIAAVNGLACGGAFYLLGESDIILAADHATFFDPHVTYGMTASYESVMMRAKLPLHEVLRMALMGSWERMSAQRAYTVGLVTEIAPTAELLDRAAWVAHAIASAPPRAIQGTLRAVWTAEELSRSQALELAWSFVALGNDPDNLDAGDQAFATGRRVEHRIR